MTEVAKQDAPVEKSKKTVLRFLHSPDKYMGELLGGHMHGRGTYFHGDGSVYVGFFRHDKRHGKGKYSFHGGGYYDGEYCDDMKHGQGVMEYPDGSQYTGNFVNNVKCGSGTYKLVDGSIYDGSFVDGNMEGQGTYTWPSGVKYVGEWKVLFIAFYLKSPDVILFLTSFLFPKSHLILCVDQAGKRHGVGTMYYKDGAKAFTADWREDQKVDLDDEESEDDDESL
jgi:hypothetical protein